MSTTHPQKLGRYEVLEEIGKGAMGVVYLARDPLIGRMVALKTFRVGFSAKDEELAQFRSRFVREAQSAGILSHPNIVTIHDVVDEGATGVCFIAMEYVKGTNLKQLLQRSDPFAPGFVADIVSQIAEALDYAHSRGVVHRDIKPANILITADNRVKITDFGIARLDTSNLTMEGQLLGTPNYMAPEQIQGKDVDHRADIFALGVVFYEMLTRKKPFQGENLTQVTHKIVYEPFTPPEEIVRDLPAGLSAVLSRCLQKDPNRRYPRAAEVARELRAASASQEALDDTSGTQEVVAPEPAAAPDFGPTRRLDREELAAAAAAAADLGPTRRMGREEIAAAAAAASAARPPAPPVEPEQVPTRRLDRAEMLAGAAPPAPSAAPKPAPPPPAPRSPAPPPAKPAPGPAAAPIPPPRPAAPAPATPVAAAPAPARSRRGLWLALGGVAAALLVGVVVVVAFAMQSEEPAPPPVVAPAPAPPPEQQDRITAMTALNEARTRLTAGDVDGAVAAVAQAELADPAHPEIPVLREAIERRRRELATDAERAIQISEGLAATRAATERKAWAEAITAGRAVLVLDPEQAEARQLVADAQRAQRRDRERLLAEQAAAATPPPAVEPTPTPPAPVAPAVPAATDAPLRIAFHSEASEGVLTVYAGERQILREPFKFVRKTGFLRTEKVSGQLEAERRIPAGPMILRVYVAIPGKSTRTVTIEREIVGGRSYVLDIQVDGEGRATADLR
jgi:serine/threonine-protein kinase